VSPAANAIHAGLGRFEVFDVAPDRLPSLGVHLALTAWPFSVHAPLTRPDPSRPAAAVFFLADSPERERSFLDLEATLAGAAARGAQYVVTHLNWTADVEAEHRAEALAQEAAGRIASMARAHAVPVHLECGGYAGGFHRAEQWARLATAHPDLGLCLDLGHLWLINRERGRSAYREIERLAPHARSLHLWAARDLRTYRRRGHVPLHPDLSPAQGWLDVERALAPVLEAHPAVPVIFEWSPRGADEAWSGEGMAWAEALISRLGGRGAAARPAST
jgi:sugar phosphate isomerase/epimerase